MWVDERIFSKGDLSQGVEGEQYSEYISYEYADNLQDRLEHVNEMIERLQAEKAMLEDHIDKKG